MNSSSSSASGRSALAGSSVGTRVATPAIGGGGGGGGGGGRPVHRGAVVDLTPARPVLKWLAIGGWATFAAEWLLMLLVLSSLTAGGGGSPVGAEPAPTAAAPAVRTPARTPAPPAATPKPPAAATRARADVLGLKPGQGHTVILLDAIEKTAPWLDRAKNKLVESLTAANKFGSTFSITVINDDGARAITRRPLAYGPASVAAVRNVLSPIRAKGTKGLGDGLDAATALKPNQVVFITARDTNWGGAVAFLESKLTVNGKRVPLHVVQINNQQVDDLRAFVTGANGGRYLVVKPGSL